MYADDRTKTPKEVTVTKIGSKLIYVKIYSNEEAYRKDSLIKNDSYQKDSLILDLDHFSEQKQIRKLLLKIERGQFNKSNLSLDDVKSAALLLGVNINE